MLTRKLGTVYLRGQGNPNHRRATTPGRALEFRGGAADILHPNDMVAALQIKGAQVEVPYEYKDSLDEWKRAVPVGGAVLADVVIIGEPEAVPEPEPAKRAPRKPAPAVPPSTPVADTPAEPDPTPTDLSPAPW